MITRRIILEHLEAYLNRQSTLAELVAWAEEMLIEPQIPLDEDADAIMGILMYLGAADTHGFLLTWDILAGFMDKLGGNMRVIVDYV